MRERRLKIEVKSSWGPSTVYMNASGHTDARRVLGKQCPGYVVEKITERPVTPAELHVDVARWQ